MQLVDIMDIYNIKKEIDVANIDDSKLLKSISFCKLILENYTNDFTYTNFKSKFETFYNNYSDFLLGFDVKEIIDINDKIFADCLIFCDSITSRQIDLFWDFVYSIYVSFTTGKARVVMALAYWK